MEQRVLSVVMPVFNEKDTVTLVLDKLLHHDFVKEVIVIDDGSSDGTTELLAAYAQSHDRVHHYINKTNIGKTGSLKRGFSIVTGDIAIIQDADLEYDPDEIWSIIEPIVLKKADVVYGSRFLVKRASRVLYFYHYIANCCLTFFSNLFTNLNMTDIETCYKAFATDIIKNMIISSTGFGFEAEVTAKVAKLKCRIFEVPISYYGRTYEEGKKIGIKDGIAAFYYILYYNLFVSREKSFANNFKMPHEK